jgi:hypothetical protein
MASEVKQSRVVPRDSGLVDLTVAYGPSLRFSWVTMKLSIISQRKGPPGFHGRPLNMGQRWNTPLPEVATVPL